MKVAKPIFIVGGGRSGSTIFHTVFSEHPNVAWLSILCDLYPDKPSMNRLLLKVCDYPLVGKLVKRAIPMGSWERYDFWEYHCKGFRHPCRDLLPEDVTNKAKGNIQNVMSETLTKKRDRLLVKITGWPKIGFLHEIFDDGQFIHILRDGRAVVNSLINSVDWWWGWRGPQSWRWGELAPSQEEEWKRYDQSFVALASIEWKILVDAVEKAKRFVDEDHFMEVKYEDFCSNPLGIFEKVVQFCGLEWPRGFRNSIQKYALRNTNYKWQKELTADQQDIAEDVMRDHLKAYGYL
jgi:hypothetical protein